jgi:hypothetical protein
VHLRERPELLRGRIEHLPNREFRRHRRTGHLRDGIGHLRGGIVRLQNRIEHSRNGILHCQTRAGHLRERVVHLRNEEAHLRKRAAHLRGRESHLRDGFGDLRGRAEHLRRRTEHLRGPTGLLRDEISIREGEFASAQRRRPPAQGGRRSALKTVSGDARRSMGRESFQGVGQAVLAQTDQFLRAKRNFDRPFSPMTCRRFGAIKEARWGTG